METMLSFWGTKSKEFELFKKPFSLRLIGLSTYLQCNVIFNKYLYLEDVWYKFGDIFLKYVLEGWEQNSFETWEIFYHNLACLRMKNHDSWKII